MIPVIWTLKAFRTYTRLIDFWEQAYPPTVVDGFYQQVEESLRRLARMPHLYAATRQKPSVRRCIVNPHTVIYYRINRQTVELLVFFDTRQDPNKLSL